VVMPRYGNSPGRIVLVGVTRSRPLRSVEQPGALKRTRLFSRIRGAGAHATATITFAACMTYPADAMRSLMMALTLSEVRAFHHQMPSFMISAQ